MPLQLIKYLAPHLIIVHQMPTTHYRLHRVVGRFMESLDRFRVDTGSVESRCLRAYDDGRRRGHAAAERVSSHLEIAIRPHGHLGGKSNRSRVVVRLVTESLTEVVVP